MITVTLPDEPVDGYAITFWILEGDHLEKYTLRYVAHTLWREMFPHDSRRIPGASFEDEWMLFRFNPQIFVGRLDGWRDVVRYVEQITENREAFTDLDLARQFLIEHIDHRCNQLAQQIKDLRRRQQQTRAALDGRKRATDKTSIDRRREVRESLKDHRQ
jgi:hypothetical protein